MGADESDLYAGFGSFHLLGKTNVTLESGGGGEENDEVIVPSDADRLLWTDSMGRGVEKSALANQPGGVGKPGWVPKGVDFPPCRVSGTCPSIKAFKRGRVQQ